MNEKKEMLKYRNRNMFLLLYPDDESHMLALEKIRNPENNYRYGCILHNADVWSKEDEKKNPEHVYGDPKKAHYHVVLQFGSAVWNTALCKELGIELNYCMKTDRKLDDLLLYLLHYDNGDKTPYDIENVEGPLRVRLESLIKKREKTEDEKVLEIIAYIEETGQENKVSYVQLVKWAASNGYWSELRRGGSMFIKCVEELNFKYNEAMYKGNHLE